MVFADKLRELTKNISRAALARKAGLSEAAISNYINAGHRPGADAALAIARATGVPLDWLIDDKCDFPAPLPSSLGAVPTDDLRRELGRRLHGTVGRSLLLKLRAAEKVDWIDVGKQLANHDLKKPLPPALKSVLMLPYQIGSLLSELQAFSPVATIDSSDPPELHQKGEPDSYTLLDLLDMGNVTDHKDGYRDVASLVLSVYFGSIVESREKVMMYETAIKFQREAAERFEQLAKARDERHRTFGKDWSEMDADERSAHLDKLEAESKAARKASDDRPARAKRRVITD